MKQEKKRRFRLFDLQREGKGVSKNVKELEPGLKKFFITYKNNFGKLIYVNIFMVLGNFPLIFIIATLAGVTKNDIYVPLSDLFQNFGGLLATETTYTPFQMSMFALEGLQNQTYAPTVWTYIFYAIGSLTLLTFGLVNAGTAYIVRNLVSGEPVFVWSDFWYALKRNWKQALPFGAIDALICALLAFNIYTTLTSTSQFFMSMLFWCNILISVLYFFMRYYIYVQMVTFDLSVFKIIKNSAIFALLGFKRNIVALLGIVLCLFIEFILLFGTAGLLVPIAVAAPLAMLFASFSYMKVYASYYKIKEIMIDPYIAAHPELYPEDEEEGEVIMRDDVTERERLEEIRRRNGLD